MGQIKVSLQASVGKGGEKSTKNGPGGASHAISPPGRFGGVTAIGSSDGPPAPTKFKSISKIIQNF